MLSTVKIEENTTAGSGQQAQREETRSLAEPLCCFLEGGRLTSPAAGGLSLRPRSANQVQADCSPRLGKARGAQLA